MKKITLLFAIFCITLSTTQAQFSQFKNKAKSMAQNAVPVLSNRTPDQGHTSDAHKEYSGKIVFADNLNDLQFKNENTAAFNNNFDAAEPIYARLYLDHSVGNTPHQGDKTYKSHVMYDLYIDGNKIPFKKAFGMYRHVPEDERPFYFHDIGDDNQLNVWTTWRPTLLPNESDDELKYGGVNIMARCFALALLDLSVGNHDIDLRMYSRDFASGAETDVLASGQFTINLTEQDKRDLAFKYAPPLPKDTWKGGDKGSIIQDIKRAFEVQLRKTPITSGINSVDWSEGVYSLTGQRYRKLAGWAVFEDSDGDGQVPITTFNFISDYSRGEWTKLRFDSHCLGCPDWDVEVVAVKASLKNN